ncbi:EamA family transporter [Microbacterium istanbulense]|uniref:EamA family transporter n=1 Tax=Microbacterium istanbulense TaxID=3122049 RepID=A0ABU8LIZ9_9MICO
MIGLSLVAALGYGLSDLIGGRAARILDPRLVALVSQVCATIIACALLVSPIGAGSPTAHDLVWGAGAGLGAAAGNILIYRGIARHSAVSVAPVSGVTAVAIPVLVDLVTGVVPTVLQAVGLALALPAIWLVSGGGRGISRAALLIGSGAGAGFGMQFTCLGQTSPNAGLAPLALAQTVSVITLIAAVGFAGAAARRATVRGIRDAAAAGLLAGVATVAFQFAVRLGAAGIAAAVTSMYPAVTVLAAAGFERQSITPRAGVGLGLCVVVLVLIAT